MVKIKSSALIVLLFMRSHFLSISSIRVFMIIPVLQRDADSPCIFRLAVHVPRKSCNPDSFLCTHLHHPFGRQGTRSYVPQGDGGQFSCLHLCIDLAHTAKHAQHCELRILHVKLIILVCAAGRHDRECKKRAGFSAESAKKAPGGNWSRPEKVFAYYLSARSLRSLSISACSVSFSVCSVSFSVCSVSFSVRNDSFSN